ncbi:MAG TPA: c-type cytochrome [Casimicrobiaceae bacterium]|nr:c-type cytochrome [Casimicrobiaceae bacterium]
MEHDPHSSFIKTPKQLVIVVLLAFAIPISMSVLLSQLATSGMETGGSKDQIAARIKPVGSIVMAEATAPKGSMTGEQVFGQTCKTCHGTGLAGAPKAGDKAAWSPRIAQGEATLVKHALDGFTGKSGTMPPRGGNSELTDDEVHRAVVYMADLGGAGWKEPPVTATTAAVASAAGATAAAVATAAPAAAAAVVASAAPAPAAPGAPVAAPADAAEGKKVYDETCHVCHGTGLLGSPKFGDKAAWAPRIAQGMDTLYNAALHGLRSMPPKGGNSALTDAQVKAGVDYMTSAAK